MCLTFLLTFVIDLNKVVIIIIIIIIKPSFVDKIHSLSLSPSPSLSLPPETDTKLNSE